MFRIRQQTRQVTFNGSGGVNSELLDPNVLDVLSVRDDDTPRLLTQGDMTEFQRTDSANEDIQGEPTKWVVDGDTLYVYLNTPDISYQFTYRYLHRPPDMTSNTDLFPLPREWERPCKLLAKSYVFGILGQPERAMAAYQEMLTHVQMRRPEGYVRDMNNDEAMVNMGGENRREW
jgi:hypothetical protein